jgi:uncharacterized protein YcgL (UPF0745 family)
MLCAIYKSFLKNETYLFIKKRDDFSTVPKMLLTQFGKPQLVSLLNLKKDQKMAIACAKKVITEIQVNGFYLQLPPPPINYLEEHKKMKKNSSNKVKISNED